MPRLLDALSRRFVCASAVVVLGGIGCGIGLSGAAENPGAGVEGDAGYYASARDSGTSVDAPKSSLMPVGEDASSLADSVSHTRGSPLCGIPSGMDGGAACNPDNGTCSPSYATGTPALDAAAFDAGVAIGLDADAPSGPQFACRVTETRSEGGIETATPTCSPAGLGTSETPCVASSDCAPGFECVINSQSAQAADASGYNALAGVCRHYCCNNLCAGERSFCDIEPTVVGSANVPVCVLTPKGDGGAACELLDDATCGGSGLVCQVVNAATGDVACVTPGTATVGESCETTKCAKELSCIAGAFPNRTCAQLCNRENSDCPEGQTCMLNAAFTSANAEIGVCTQ